VFIRTTGSVFNGTAHGGVFSNDSGGVAEVARRLSSATGAGGVTMQVLQQQYGECVFSPCEQYRYALWRLWQPQQPAALFIGLNPSTTPAGENNATIRRCVNFAKAWGYGGIALMNLFAYRADTPPRLRQAAAPIGPDNDRWLLQVAEQAGIIVAAWGNDGAYLGRSAAVRSQLPARECAAGCGVRPWLVRVCAGG